MSKLHSYVFAGFGIGVVISLSTGVAVGGTAYNGALVFGPLGALIGWLFARRGNIEAKSSAAPTALNANDRDQIESSVQIELPDPKPFNIELLFRSAVHLLAGIWNFHIDLIDMTGMLPAFKKNPWLFAALAIVISIFFPPFIVIYIVLYAAATESGASSESDFRAKIQ